MFLAVSKVGAVAFGIVSTCSFCRLLHQVESINIHMLINVETKYSKFNTHKVKLPCYHGHVYPAYQHRDTFALNQIILDRTSKPKEALPCAQVKVRAPKVFCPLHDTWIQSITIIYCSDKVANQK